MAFPFENTGKLEAKRQRLEQIVIGLLCDPNFSEEISHLCAKCSLTKEEILEAFIAYNLDIYAYDNDIYSSFAQSFVMFLHSLHPESYHQGRQDVILKFIKISSPYSILDVGFGVPTKYVRWCLETHQHKITLCDFSELALKFSENVLEHWQPNWKDQIHFMKADMMDFSQKKTFYDLYLFQDSIEHTPDPTQCMKNYIENSPGDAKFILSIPIMPLIPLHYISWNTIQEANEWLEVCGLFILHAEQVRTNPEVDLFADAFEEGFVNHIVFCKKKPKRKK